MATAVTVSWKEKEAAIHALEKSGKVDPNDLIHAAMSEDHPCHNDFTWDTEEAARERWRDQARALIRRCSFEVQVEEVGSRVATYVPSPDDEDTTFHSLQKMRSKTRTARVLVAEVNMLHGLASRVYGIALAKQGMVGDETVSEIRLIRDQVAEVKAKLSE
jgi:hypothetical protein